MEKGYPRYKGIVGGAGTYAKTFANELVNRGFKVSVICGRLDGKQKSFKDGEINVYPDYEYHPISYFIRYIPIIKVLSKLFRYLENGYNINRIISKINAIHKITYIEFTEGGDFWTSLLKKHHYISHLHGSSYTIKKLSGRKFLLSDWLQRQAELYFIKKANIVVAPSKVMSSHVSNEFKGKIKPLTIPYPLSDKLIQKSANGINRMTTQSNKINIIFASRNDPVKGGELLIDTLKRLPQSIKNDINVKIFGYRPKIDVSDIEFIDLNDFIPKEQLLIEYENSDICVIPSLFDNSPNTVYEAMALGKIVVASNVGGIPEIIGNKGCGFIFQSNNINDFKEKLIDAINLISNNKHSSMIQNAKARINKYADLHKNVNQRLALLKL